MTKQKILDTTNYMMLLLNIIKILRKSLPFLGLNFNLYIRSIAGMRKASVFPDPVLAAPTRSLPSNRGGIALACISVIVVKPISFTPMRVASHTLPSRDENF